MKNLLCWLGLHKWQYVVHYPRKRRVLRKQNVKFCTRKNCMVAKVVSDEEMAEKQKHSTY